MSTTPVTRQSPARHAVVVTTLLLAACGAGPSDTSPPAANPPPVSIAEPAEVPDAPATANAVALPASAVGSCSSPAIGFCSDFTGADHTAAVVKADCALPGQVYSESGCPVEGRAGSCLNYPGKGIEIQMRYSLTFPGGAAAAQAQCLDMLKGTWTPG